MTGLAETSLVETREVRRPAVAQQLVRGKLLAHERVELLLDPGSFRELQAAWITADNSQLRGKRSPGDGVITGGGTVDGRRVLVFAQDPTVIGGSLGSVGGAKIHRLQDLAIETGTPIVGIYDGGGARIQEGVASLCAFGGIFARNTRASGVVPQISVVLGTAVGGAVYSPALTDFVLMVERTAAMAITGPRVVREVTGEDVTLDQLGGAAVHAERSGVVHLVAPDEPACLAEARRLLGFLPSSNREPPPAAEPAPPGGAVDPPDGSTGAGVAGAGFAGAAADVRRLARAVADRGDLLEYAARWSPAVVCALARVEGRPVGIVANQRGTRDGRLDVGACEKAARFVRTCDGFGLPLVTIVGSGGLAAGPGPEHRGLVRAAAKLTHAYAEATVPRVHLVVAPTAGLAAVTMGVTRATSDVRLAWPDAGPVPDPAGNGAEVGAGVGAGVGGNGRHDAAARGVLDDVIEPCATRDALAHALAMTGAVARHPIPRKHENLPL